MLADRVLGHGQLRPPCRLSGRPGLGVRHRLESGLWKPSQYPLRDNCHLRAIPVLD